MGIVQSIRKKAPLFTTGALIAVFSVIATAPKPVAAAACAAPSTNYGSIASSVTTPSAATYRLWSRIMVPDATNKTYLLEIDGNTCYTVGGAAIAANTWVWVDYQNGNTGSKIQQSMTKGSHSVKMIGNAPGVKVDRLLAVSDLNCTPTGTGENCNVATPADSKPPTVSLTAPAENATVSGTVNVTATASDESGISKVDFFDNSTLIGTDTSNPYAVSWNTAKVPAGSHLLTAKAYDAAGNVATDTNTVKTQNGDSQAPTAPTELKATATAHNKVTLTWKAATDNTGVAGYIVMRDDQTLARTSAVTTYDDASTLPGTQYTYKVIAFDGAENKSPASDNATVTTPTVADDQPPSKPTGLKGTTISPSQITLAWAASTDNIGVAGYEVYRSSGKDQPKRIAMVTKPGFGDASLTPNTEYTYYIVATDANGNRSEQSDNITARTQTKKLRTVLKGVVLDAQTNKPINQARIAVNIDKFKQLYRTGKMGTYRIWLPSGGKYSVTYEANGYQPKTLTLTAPDAQVFVQDVTLTKR